MHTTVPLTPGSLQPLPKSEKLRLEVTAAVRAETRSYDAVTDGMFPLITNDRQMTPAEVLAAYRYQPNLERRNHMLKGPQRSHPCISSTRTASRHSCSVTSSR